MHASLKFKIPVELVERIADGKCVLFLGSDVDYNTPDWAGPPSQEQLATALATKYDWIKSKADFRLATEEFLSREPKNRHALIEFLNEQIGHCIQPGPLHQLLVDLHFNTVVTNGYDDLLESAMRAAGRRVLQIVRDEQIAYTSENEEIIIIRLSGIFDRPHSLVLTRRDQFRDDARLSERLRVVRGYFSSRRLLFMGWNPGDESLQRLFIAATEALGEHKRRNYIVWSKPLEASIVAHWQEDNVEIIRAECLPFLHALKQRVQQKHLQNKKLSTPPELITGKLPYKFLDFFDENDQDIFYGRETETPSVYRHILSHPLLVLFGQSGVGKTSFIRAGVTPLLQSDGYHTSYVRILGDPLQALRQAIIETARQDNLIAKTSHLMTDLPLREFLEQFLDENDKLVVFLDQFEEFFIRPLSQHTRHKFWQELGSCQGMMAHEIRFVICLREDYLAFLDEARKPIISSQPAPIPNILVGSYRLNPLGTDATHLAIVEPARNMSCQVDPFLIKVLLGQTTLPVSVDSDELQNNMPTQKYSLLEDNGQVLPYSIQIVMDQLYRTALAEAGYSLPSEGPLAKTWQPPQLTLSVELYESLGGITRILSDYVKSALDKVSARGGDRHLAEILLKVLTTARQTKAALTEKEIQQGIIELFPEFDIGKDIPSLKVTTMALVNLRLIRNFQKGSEVLIELAHDHMAKEIGTWISDEEMQLKLVRELLRREMDSWYDHGYLITLDALRLINEYRDQLKLGETELELILRSALATNYELIYWTRRAQESGLEVDVIEINHATIKQFILNYYNLPEMRDLCFQLGIDYDDLSGDQLTSKVLELIRWMMKNGRFDQLLITLRQTRPRAFKIDNVITNLTGLYDALAFFERDNAAQFETQLQILISQHYSVTKIRTLCFLLDCNYDNLTGNTRSEKVLELIRWSKRYSRFDQLLILLRETIPNYEFGENLAGHFIERLNAPYLTSTIAPTRETQLFKFIIRNYNLLQLQKFSNQLVPYESRPVYSSSDDEKVQLEDQTRELILFVKRHNKLNDLISLVQQDFPDSLDSLDPSDTSYAFDFEGNENIFAFFVHRFIVEHFSYEDLQEMSFEMGISFENLAGATRAGKAWELICYCECHGQLQMLNEILQQKHPQFHFHLMPSGIPFHSSLEFLLYQIIQTYYSREEFETLCMYLAVNSDFLSGQTLGGKARELVLHMQRRGRLKELATEIRRERPFVHIQAD